MCFFSRYTIVMVYYAFSLLFMMIFRPLFSARIAEGRGAKSIYAALYFFPILVVIQAVLGGLICKYAAQLGSINCQSLDLLSPH